MTILWVKVGGLWPAHTGGRLRSLHLIEELSRRHAITLLTTHGPTEDPSALAARLPERTAELPYPSAVAGAVMTAPEHIGIDARRRLDLIVGHVLG